MGAVYLGRDERLDREVAIKILPAGTVPSEEVRLRFRKEAQILSRLNHPNIATIYDFNTIDGIDFLAMEFVDGTTLSARVGQNNEEASPYGPSCRQLGATPSHDARHEPECAARWPRHQLPADPKIRERHKPVECEPVTENLGGSGGPDSDVLSKRASQTGEW